ncbi:MAG TPA: tRNA dimethylallyltransferase, partial [Pilimelia sp.]|nr:tRNA dimethylallyltransferase [Pilimelia sp.]
LDDLKFPGTDDAVRERYEAELASVGPEVLHRRLQELDPAAAIAILPSNGRRIVRALEVIELTGAPFTASLPAPRPVYRAVTVGVDLDTAALDERIERRVAAMWAAGLVAEVRGLAAHGLPAGRTASRALGYQQVLSFLAGGCTEDEARAETVRATRRFVRRQRSWFRRDPGVAWLDAARPGLVADAVAAVAAGAR